jgi:2-amino-4-hydroxy-6-hydroxymethyldihydropteridine diphosphokinase
MRGVYLGLGSNLGEREANLAAAVDRLEREPGVRVLRRSSLYETQPVGVIDQPSFLNAAVEIETELAPRDLLGVLKRIELDLGRRPGRRWGERLIDIDLLLYDDLALRDRDLTVPHREMWGRLFVLVPLAELAPDVRSPDGRTIQQVIAALDDSRGIRPYRATCTTTLSSP